MPPSVTAADSFKLSLEAGDVVLDFGRAASAPGAGVTVTDHVVVPVDTARRLLVTLGEALARHEAALRAAQAKALAPEDAAAATRPGQAPLRASPDSAGEQGALLFRLVGELGVSGQYERSLRISEAGLEANRFLLTLEQRDIPGGRERVLDICRRLGMPEEALAAASERYGMANCIHFGFEGDAGRGMCKLYLERAVSPEEARLARAAGESALLHLAFKWTPGGSFVTTEYRWHPALTAAEIAQRLERHVYAGASGESLEIAKGVLSLAAGRIAAEQLQYLEVQERETDRRSFDLNLYNARLQVKEMQPQLNRMRELHKLRPGQFQALYDQIKLLPLGHLAGGVHRNGKDFFNLYYGVTAFPRFHEGFR